ncbi:hypothetical protein N7490_010591 [Penicillium lividum]|nr:hypothetical protein N7490_010591 [Penicillium lividum]
MARSNEKTQGQKRPADGDPDGAQPLTKRFGFLQIDHDSHARTKDTDTSSLDSAMLLDDTSSLDSAMLLDDTKHTTYIYNLDHELAEPEPTDTLVLLPLAARMISMPKSVLSSNPAQGKELVLYTEPSSLTVPKEQDSVRKAIIESRARARASRSIPVNHSDSNANYGILQSDHDDPMDMDLDP